MFILQLLTSFLVGGLFIAMQTLIAERLKPKWRGIALTIPSTLALSFFFIGLFKTPNDVVEAAQFMPAALGINYLYIFVFALLSRFGLLASLLVGFGTLIIGVWLLALSPPESMLTSTFSGFFLICIAYAGVRMLPEDHRIKAYPMNLAHIVSRSLIGGTIVGLTVFLAKIISNFWGGVFSVFPAVFTSVFIIYFFLQGKSVIPAVARSLFFPGSIGLLIYMWTASLAFPAYGIWIGTLAAYIATLLFFWLYHRLYEIITT